MANSFLNKRIHVLGIAGTMTAPMSAFLKKSGAIISGSDQDKIYPPISKFITDNNIPLNITNFSENLDLAIIGSSFKSFQRCVDEFSEVIIKNIPHISATSFISQNLIKDNSIVVAGSYGKTTITSLLSHVMIGLGLDPSYFYGGLTADGTPPFHISDSKWSVIEGDESINGLDTKAKFLYYPTKYLILTSTCWEHKDSYKTAEDNLNAYRQLVQSLPSDGILIYNPQDTGIKNLLVDCRCSSYPYENFDTDSKLIGEHNRQNINAVLTLCSKLGFNLEAAKQLVSEFCGVKRRLEVLFNQKNIIVVDDFAQSADRVESALNAIKFEFKDYKIVCYYEPHASFLLKKSSLIGMGKAFEPADKVLLGKLKFSGNIDKTDRVTAADWKQAVGEKLQYTPDQNDLLTSLSNQLTPRTVLVHFSSGGKDGLDTLNKVVKKLSESI